MAKLIRTILRVESNLIYLTSDIGNQTMAINQALCPKAQAGDVLEIVVEDGKPKSAAIKQHVKLNSNDN